MAQSKYEFETVFAGQLLARFGDLRAVAHHDAEVVIACIGRNTQSQASCAWQQPARITLHDGIKLCGIER